MKSILGNTFKLVILVAAFAASIILPTVVIPVSPELAAKVGAEIQDSFFVSMGLVSLLGAIVLSVIVKFSDWGGIRLFLSLCLSFWGIEYFQAQIESFFFRDAFTFMSTMEMVNVALRGALTTLIAVAVSVLVWGKARTVNDIDIGATVRCIDRKLWAKKAFLFSGIYIAIYLFFGYFVAWQFEAVRIFYSGSAEQLSWIDQIAKTITERPYFIPYNIMRGVLWVVFSMPVVFMMRGNRFRTVLSLMLLFSFHGFQIVMARGFFPPDVLVGHAIETTISATLYGGIIGFMFYMPAKQRWRAS